MERRQPGGGEHPSPQRAEPRTLARLICHRESPRCGPGADGASPARGRLPAPAAQSCCVRRPAAKMPPSPRQQLARPGPLAPPAPICSSAWVKLSPSLPSTLPWGCAFRVAPSTKPLSGGRGRQRDVPHQTPERRMEQTHPQHKADPLVSPLNRAFLPPKHSIPKAHPVPGHC